MTLQDVIAAETSTVFLNTTAGFAVDITHWIKGDSGVTETITAIVDRDYQQRSPGGTQDSISDGHGQRAIGDVALEVPDTVTHDPSDKWLLDDGTTLVNAVHVIGQDIAGGTITILCRDPSGAISSTRSRVRR